MSSFHSWLPIVLPANARRMRVALPDTAELLADAGADLVEEDPEVEMADHLGALRHDAPYVVLSLGENQPEGGGRLLRAGRRAGAALRVRASSRSARLALGRLGYEEVRIVRWDYDQAVQLGRRIWRRGLPEFLPERAIVTGSRGPAGLTLLEAVVDDASRTTGHPVHVGRPLIRKGILVVVAETSVVRIAVGAAAERLRRQQEVLGLLSGAPPIIADRLPAPVVTGRVGLGDWSSEPRIQGRTLSGEIPDRLLWECMDFLAALHDVDAPGTSHTIAEGARRCAAVCPEPAQRAALLALGEELETLLADIPRGFGHGDFWMGNVLCQDDRLTGVIDWDGGGPGRLPLLDLIHLQVSGFRDGRHISMGDAIVASQLAATRTGGGQVTRAYCRRIGLDPDSTILEALVLAFWLDLSALELELRSDAITPGWIGDNILTVLDHLRRSGRLPGA